MKRVQKGFTLIEVMVAVAIVAILATVAVPVYTDYVTRGRLTEAFTGLGGAQTSAEQFWANQRTYVGFKDASTFPKSSAYFDYAISDVSPSSYTLTATGKGNMKNFVYTIDQSGKRATTSSPTGWGTNTDCWVDKKGGKCSN
jgi:type IV pilus assembly protein PilE